VLTPYSLPTFQCTAKLYSKNDSNCEEVEQQQAFPSGTIVEFQEKKREHVGKILEVDRKSNGAVRYEIEEFPTGKHFSVADKEVSFSIPTTNNEKQAEKLLEQVEHAHAIDEVALSKELEITPDLLEMAWEEAVEDEEAHNLTPNDLVELVHSHKADPVEKYEAWRLLKSEIGHVFFKELKQNGRVVAFKPKARNSVEASKDIFLQKHDEDFYQGMAP